jgi:hypothetical protein
MKKLLIGLTLLASMSAFSSYAASSHYNNVPTFVKNSESVSLTSPEVRDELILECEEELTKEKSRIEIEFATHYGHGSLERAKIISEGTGCKIHTQGIMNGLNKIFYQITVQFLR